MRHMSIWLWMKLLLLFLFAPITQPFLLMDEPDGGGLHLKVYKRGLVCLEPGCVVVFKNIHQKTPMFSGWESCSHDQGHFICQWF